MVVLVIIAMLTVVVITAGLRLLTGAEAQSVQTVMNVLKSDDPQGRFPAEVTLATLVENNAAVDEWVLNSYTTQQGRRHYRMQLTNPDAIIFCVTDLSVTRAVCP